MKTRASHLNSYESVFDSFVTARGDEAGLDDVMDWTKRLEPGATILDLGCGHGAPISVGLATAGFEVFGVDSSPRMIAAFRERLPNATTECASIQHSNFFGRPFDAMVAWGVLFLLSPRDQELVIGKVARALNPGGSFLFTTPHMAATWEDTLGGVGFPSVSLGAECYAKLLDEQDLALVDQHSDHWQNDYFIAKKPRTQGDPSVGAN